MPTKRGMSLIEVVVALGILAMVFAGTVSLIVQVVHLELSARNRTEAVALAQQELANGVKEMGNGCTKTEYSNTTTRDLGGTTYIINSNTTFLDSSLGDLPDATGAIFARVNVSVEWQERNLPTETYEVKQVTRMGS